MNTSFNYIIVEDEPLQQTRLKNILNRRLDWNANWIKSFEEPMEAYRFLQSPNCPHIDILILDMALPNEESGLSFINSIKEMRSDPWILIVSGHNQLKELYEQKLKHLVGDYVNKPYEPKRLTDAVEYLLPQQKHVNSKKITIPQTLTLNYTINHQRENKIFKIEELIFFRICQPDNKNISVGTTLGYNIVNGPLKDLRQKLEHHQLEDFVQIARDCIVHLRYILRYNPKRLTFVGVQDPEDRGEEVELVVAPSFRKGLKLILKEQRENLD